MSSLRQMQTLSPEQLKVWLYENSMTTETLAKLLAISVRSCERALTSSGPVDPRMAMIIHLLDHIGVSGKSTLIDLARVEAGQQRAPVKRRRDGL